MKSDRSHICDALEHPLDLQEVSRSSDLEPMVRSSPEGSSMIYRNQEPETFRAYAGGRLDMKAVLDDALLHHASTYGMAI